MAVAAGAVDFWLWPLPPAGPLTFVCRRPASGIDECQTVLEGDLLVPALDQVRTLWPWEPHRYVMDEEPAQPQLPADGWFARNAGLQARAGSAG